MQDGQAEAIFGQRDLAAVVAARHRADLGHGLVAFVHEQQRVVGQIFEQRAAARRAGGRRGSVVLDARARAGGGDHLKVEVGALLKALRFQQLALGVQLLQPLLQLEADGVHRLLHRRAGGDVVRIGVDADLPAWRPPCRSADRTRRSSTSSPKKLMRQAMSS
jgi:hypothetical protein